MTQEELRKRQALNKRKTESRGERRARNRTFRKIAATIQADEILCACWGVIAGDAQYAVRPALCGHWFRMVRREDGKLECGAMRWSERYQRAAPITSIVRGKMVPMRATVALSFKKGSKHALKFASSVR